jgi:ribosome-associated heat shock protein Hsp15
MDEHAVRIDKWLWAVRIFKTRSLATEACRSGKVTVQEMVVKPSRIVRPGETISVFQAPLTRTVRVIEVIGNRVSAKLVAGFMEDLTPEEEYMKLRHKHDAGFEFRERGIGRPTKRERRQIEYLKSYLDE